MLSKKIEEALNGQINAELYSAYLYLSMVAYFESSGYPGSANWMRAQTWEELTHAMKIFDYVCEQGGKVVLTLIEASLGEWESLLAAFEAALEHEQKVTGLINRLVEIAKEEEDEVTVDFLQWFVDEQVEEEGSVDKVIKKVKSAGKNLLTVDLELGRRMVK